MKRFPESFLWGAACSAYQVEGDNAGSDWWQWEKESGKENSGRACRHYELFEQDFDLAKSLHHNAHRLSIEWARIEPSEGEFSRRELQHYLDVILALRRRGIEPLVTLHHFTNPAWFTRAGGWAVKGAPARFLNYCRQVVPLLAPHVRYWFTINEPNVYVSHSYILGVWPPQEHSLLKAKAAEDNMVAAHIMAYSLIHSVYKEAGLEAPLVGIAQNMMAFVACTQRPRDRLAAYLRDRWYNFGFLDRISRNMDFIGVNYYSRQLVELKRWGLRNLAADVCKSGRFPAKKNSLGWDIYPEGLFGLLVRLKKYRVPLLIAENGICTGDDALRWEYIRAHLEVIRRAMESGAPVTGYLYWSLLDNFEWDKGFSPRFGLVEVDYATYQRTARESARKYGRVCETGVLE